MVLDLLADAPQIAGGRVQPLPTEGTISVLNIPHSSMVFDLHQATEIPLPTSAYQQHVEWRLVRKFEWRSRLAENISH